MPDERPMLSDRIQRRIERLLEQTDEAVERRDWSAVEEATAAVLAADPENADALTYRAMAERGRAALAGEPRGIAAPSEQLDSDQEALAEEPVSFCDGRYEVKRFLGEGGKKRVYLAHDTKLDRDVAFALIKADGLDEDGVRRIKREAQAMGRLGDHPHIVSVFDIGELPSAGAGDWGLGVGSQPYLVTQLMSGGDLEGLLQKAPNHRFSLDMVLLIADQICQALEYAHGKGIIHRDLKPGNVWLTGDPDLQSPAPNPQPPPVAKLGDFGLAVALDQTRLTQAGMMVGTVSYMPPEQAMGGAVTPRSDLYSLGAMLYEMVTGRPPFVGDESVAIITQHLNTPPVAPSWHAPDLSPGLEVLILRLLEKDPAKRPASASEVRGMLAGVAPTPTPAPTLREGQTGADGSPLPKLGEGPGVRAVPQPPGPSPLYRRTFVGREAELRQLEAAFDGAVSGRGALVTLVGEPGIGKTALCEQLATYVAVRGGKALIGHCYEEGSLSLPYLAFVEAMRSYVLARDPDGLKQDLGSGAADVARIVSEIRDRLPAQDSGLSTQHSSSLLAQDSALGTQHSSEPDADRWRLYQAVTTFLRNAGAVQPLLIVLEDLHWSDRGTLDLLIHLARNLAGARLLLVGTYRDVEVDRAHPLSAALAELRRTADFHRIPLRGLTPDEVQRMLSAISGQEIAWSLAEAVHRQTEGNPLFIQEVTRYLVEERMLGAADGRSGLAAGAALEGTIPEGLREVIGRRLSRLSPECNRLLTTAAVIGRDFRLDTLETVADLGEEAVLVPLEEALRVGVLEDQSRPGQVRYRFAHAFFRQTLYEEVITPRRLRLHQQVARTLEAQYGNRLEEHAAELAEHFAQSSDPAELAKAVRYGRMAATRALAVYAYGEAVRLLRGAVQVQELVDPDDRETRCDLLLELGAAMAPGGEPLAAAEEIAPQAFALAEALGDRARAFHACSVALGAMRRYGGTTLASSPAARTWAERADRSAAPGTAERVRADNSLSFALRGAGRRVEAWELLVRAIDLARRLGDSPLLFEIAGRATTGPTAAPEDEPARRALLDEVLALPRDGVPPFALGQVLWHGGRLRLSWGDRAGAEELWRETAALAERTRDSSPVLRSLATPLLLATLDGDLEGAIAAGEALMARSEEMGMGVNGKQDAYLFATRALLLLGRAAEALENLLTLRELAGRGYSGIALCLAHLGRHEEARGRVAEEYGEHARDVEGPDASTTDLIILLQTVVLMGDTEAAGRIAPRLEPVSHFIFAGYDGTCVARHLGAAAALLGDRVGARARYAQALEVAERVRHRPEIALTRLAIAELLLEEAVSYQPSAVSNEVDEAKLMADKLKAEGSRHLDFAIEEFRAMKMQPSLERALRHKRLLTA